MWQRGYHFGTSLRSVGALWQGEGEVLCQVNAHAGDRDRSRVQLLDCCLQLPAAIARADTVDDIYLPVGFDQLRFSDPAGRLLWGYAVLRSGPAMGGDPIFDVYLLTENGDVVAALTGLHSKRVAAETLAAEDAQDPEIYAVTWQPAPRPNQRQPKHDPAGAWLILADRAGTGGKLADWLSAEGQRCLLVLAGGKAEPADANTWPVDPARPDDTTRRLKELIAANSPVRGVVYCWGLDVGSQISLDIIQPLVGDGRSFKMRRRQRSCG